MLVAAGDGVADHLHDLAREQPLDHGLDRLAGDEGDHLARVELAELILVVGEQALGGEHHQHRVVALEGGEDVGVGLQRGEPVDGHVAGAAAALAAGLDRVVACQLAVAFIAGGERLELAALALGRILGAEHGVELLAQLGLGEVQRVGLGQQRHQPALVGAVVEDRRPRPRPAGPNWRRRRP